MLPAIWAMVNDPFRLASVDYLALTSIVNSYPDFLYHSSTIQSILRLFLPTMTSIFQNMPSILTSS